MGFSEVLHNKKSRLIKPQSLQVHENLRIYFQVQEILIQNTIDDE